LTRILKTPAIRLVTPYKRAPQLSDHFLQNLSQFPDIGRERVNNGQQSNLLSTRHQRLRHGKSHQTAKRMAGQEIRSLWLRKYDQRKNGACRLLVSPTMVKLWFFIRIEDGGGNIIRSGRTAH
jgi:hypothetical protein